MINLTNTTPAPVYLKKQGMVKIETRSAKRKPIQPVELCLCKSGCEYVEFAFYNLNNTDSRENDYSTLYVQKGDPTESIEFKLIDEFDEETSLTATINDSMRGYLVVDWKQIANLYGNGLYKLKAISTLFGEVTEFTTHKYLVAPFNEQRASGTVVIETIKTGSILNGNDYSGSEFKGRIRIRGLFNSQKINLEREEFERVNRRVDLISQTLVNSYTLTTNLIDFKLNNKFIEDQLSSNIFITTYNDLQNEKFIRKEVFCDSIDKTEFTNNTSAIYTVNFIDPIKQIKRYGYKN